MRLPRLHFWEALGNYDDYVHQGFHYMQHAFQLHLSADSKPVSTATTYGPTSSIYNHTIGGEAVQGSRLLSYCSHDDPILPFEVMPLPPSGQSVRGGISTCMQTARPTDK